MTFSSATLVLIALLPPSFEGVRLYEPTSGDYFQALLLGIEEAEREIAEGRMTIYTSGLSFSIENLDRSTGLRYKSVGGCVIDDQILGRTVGHNAIIRGHLRAFGIPPCSFKPWEDEIFELAGQFRGVEGLPEFEFRPDGEEVRIAVEGGPFVVFMAKRQDALRGWLSLRVERDGQEVGVIGAMGRADRVRVRPGPEGSDLIFLACREEGEDSFAAISLSRAQLLRRSGS